MAQRRSATCLPPFPSFSSFLYTLNKDMEEEEVLSSFIEGQIDDSQITQAESFDSLDSSSSIRSNHKIDTDSMLQPPSSTVLNGAFSVTTTNEKSQKVVKKSMSSSMNQVTIIWSLAILLLITLSIPSSCGLELKPPTSEKEVFTGDSFVVTCLTESPSSNDLKLAWIAPDGREVASVPTAPIYVSEKPDGLQIVFLRHAKKHSGRYLCVQTRVSVPLNPFFPPFSY